MEHLEAVPALPSAMVTAGAYLVAVVGAAIGGAGWLAANLDALLFGAAVGVAWGTWALVRGQRGLQQLDEVQPLALHLATDSPRRRAQAVAWPVAFGIVAAFLDGPVIGFVGAFGSGAWLAWALPWLVALRRAQARSGRLLGVVRQSIASVPSSIVPLCSLDELAAIIDGRIAIDGERSDTFSTSLFYAGRFTDAAQVIAAQWRLHRRPVHAFNLACCAARLGRNDDAIGWLNEAVGAGGYPEDPADDPDLASLAGDPRFDRARVALLVAWGEGKGRRQPPSPG